MALDKMDEKIVNAPLKDLYEIGEIPPLGHVPAKMHAWCIRQDRQGEPDQAMQLEVVDVKKPDSHEVVVLVMAAGVNYNGIWAGLGIPISMFDVHGAPYHIAGSDAAVWALDANALTSRCTAAYATAVETIAAIVAGEKPAPGTAVCVREAAGATS